MELGGLWWTNALTRLSLLRGTGLTPGRSTKTLSATQLINWSSGFSSNWHTHINVIWFEHPWIPSHWRTNFSSLKKKNNLFIRLRPTASYLSGKHSVHSHTCASKHVCWLASVYCVPAIFQVWCQGWWRKQDMILGLKELTDTFNLVKALSNLLCSIGFPCQALKTFSVNHWS